MRCLNSLKHVLHSTAWLLFAVCALGLPGARSSAQEKTEGPIYEQEPHDLLTLTPEFKSQSFKIYLIENRDRAQRQNANPTDELRIRLLSHPEREFDVAWKDIANLEFFDELILKESIRLTDQGEFDTAYHHFAFLLKEYPSVPGLSNAIERFLLADASSTFRAGNLNESLAILEELYRRDPKRPGAQQGIQRVTEQLFRQYMRKKDFRAAQQTITWAAEKFGRESLGATLSSWEKELAGLAEVQRSRAQEFVNQNDYRAAYLASTEMMAIWPSLNGASELSAKIAQRYPVANVGVTQPAGVLNPRRFEDWAARRAGRLRQRLLVEIDGYGSEGGLYISPIAAIQRSDDGLELVLKMRRDLTAESGLAVSGYDVTRALLGLADAQNPDFSPVWRQVMDNVNVEDVFDVHARFRKFYLRPEAILQVPLADSRDDEQQLPTQPYRVLERGEKVTRFELNPNYGLVQATQPREIVERLYTESTLALQALQRGEIDVVDRIYPGDLELLREAEGITVESYSVPSVHMLVPNYERAYPGSRTFRRALEYGIHREVLLKEDLLGGKELEGCRVISGPLPAGRSREDALSYAYDASIVPRPYEPRLAVTLSVVAKSELTKMAEKASEPAPGDPDLVIVYPDSEIPRIACQGISQYLTAIGISCTAKPLAPGRVWPEEGERWDFLYMEVVMAEPVVDVRRLLGAEGVTRGGSTYLEAALRRLVSSANWAEARDHLNQIHRLAFEEVAVIPLWQLVDHFAYRSTILGLDLQPISLYENIENWQVQSTRFAQTR